MKKSEIFQMVLSAVSEQTEIQPTDILSFARTEELIDARCMVVYFCKMLGLTTTYLQEQMHRQSSNSIQHLYNMYATRRQYNRFFAHNSLIVERQLVITE